MSALLDQIMERIEVDGNGCWVWQLALNRTGYGIMKRSRWNRSKLVHRVAYEEAVGVIPDGLVIDHLCRNRACCNPSHLEPVTQEVNIARGIDGLAVANQKRRSMTHCKRGHEFTPENTYVFPSNGQRRCRTCFNARQNARNAALRGAA